MSSYIKSEFYRLLRNKWTYLFIGICSLLLLTSNIVLAAVKYSDSNFGYATTSFSFAFLESNMNMIYLLCIMVTGMIFGNEHNNHTMKNSISYGISRGTIYFGKLFIQVSYAVIAFTIIIGVHIISGYLLLENSKAQEFQQLLRTCFACVPIFLFGIATTHCFVFIIEGVGGAIAASCGLMLALPTACNVLGMRFVFFKKLGEILPWNILNASNYWSTDTGFQKCWFLGILQMVIIALVGYVVFRKKEIK